jgi:hydroxybutyrate-dimer hydrolase
MSAITRATLAAIPFALAACSSKDSHFVLNAKPDYIKGAIVSTTYDGSGNDLLTAGLGKSGLAGAAPVAANPTSPTAEELRKIAIYNNYRALVDMTANGGYGSLYGSNVDSNGVVTATEGKIAGEEHIAFADDGTGRQNVTLMVQIPSTFTVANACIVTAASSDSRGIYGAIATAGEWGLKKGCAVAYTDKGTGNGAHDLAGYAVNLMRGERTPLLTAGSSSIFKANLNAVELTAYNGQYPNRWAWKHAHSQQNPEKDWGRDTLRAVEFAFYMLNQKFGDQVGNDRAVTINKDNTIVIASSVSNGGGAAIAAAEQDTGGLIDGVAVAEPQIQMNLPASIVITRGGVNVAAAGKTLYDYFTIANLYEPCAALAPASAAAPLGAGVLINSAAAANRCTALRASARVTGATTTEQANSALAKMLASGWEQDSVLFMPSHYALAVLPVALTYANAYSKASVADNLCTYSFGAMPVAGVPPPLPAAAAAAIFGTGNGVPPTGGVVIIKNNSVGGAAIDAASITPTTGKADLNFEGAQCLSDLLMSPGSLGVTLRESIDSVKRTGNLRGKPAVIVHGRNDTLVPVNHTSRPYYAMNKTVDGASKLAYYEVTNAQHFDGFLGLAGYDTRLVPLHRYFIQAMDIVYANLKSNTAIPPSQVVRTTPRGGTPGAAPAITVANVPPIAATPLGSNTITFSNNTLTIPE